MPAPRIPDEKVHRILELRARGVSITQIARELELHRTTVGAYISNYAAKGGAVVTPIPREETQGGPPPRVGEICDRTAVDGTVDATRLDKPFSVEEVMSLCKLDPRKWVPQYFKPNIWQGYGKLKVDGAERFEKINIFQSKLTCKRIITEELEAAILEFIEGSVTPRPRPPLAELAQRPERPFLVCWGLWDAHLGMYAWNSEVGADFDVSIARRRILNSIDDMLLELRQYPTDRIVMPIGNDFMHFDSVRHKTAFGDHPLDTDTRFSKVYLVAAECLEYMIDRALEIAGRIDVLYIPGNHDTSTSFTLCALLQAHFRNDPRVVVDLGPNPRKYVTHGGTLLGFDHGADATKNQLSLIFSMEAKEHWSRSTYREIQIGHTHQRAGKDYEGTIPTNGVLIRTNPALCNNDFWHHRQGLIGEPVKSVEAWRYDRVGYRGSHVAWARDGERD